MISLDAPAKLNLFLRVLGKRSDGYHQIETVFARIDLADELLFSEEPQGIILTSDEPSLPCNEENLIMKAAQLLKKTSGLSIGACVNLKKRIPIAAGLGGGSSDAAATLVGLNRLWSLGMSRSQLLPLAEQLGADVSFFLYDTPMAIGRLRGEICKPIVKSMMLDLVLVVPDERLSTRDIYESSNFREGFDLTASGPSSSIIEHALSNGSLSELAKGLWNDLEPEAIRRCPVIASIQKQLCELGCIGARMSGSGPSVFGLCESKTQAQEIVSQLHIRLAPSWRIMYVHTDKPLTAWSTGESSELRDGNYGSAHFTARGLF